MKCIIQNCWMDFRDKFGTIYFSRYVTIREEHSSIVLSLRTTILNIGYWRKIHFFNTIFVSSHMYPENPEGTQVIVGSMNMGYISDTARNRAHDLFRPKREPIPLGHSDGLHIPVAIQIHNIVPIFPCVVFQHIGTGFIIVPVLALIELMAIGKVFGNINYKYLYITLNNF